MGRHREPAARPFLLGHRLGDTQPRRAERPLREVRERGEQHPGGGSGGGRGGVGVMGKYRRLWRLSVGRATDVNRDVDDEIQFQGLC